MPQDVPRLQVGYYYSLDLPLLYHHLPFIHILLALNQESFMDKLEAMKPTIWKVGVILW